jgi:hypothetical protein
MFGIYKLSKRTFSRMIEKSFTNPEFCPKTGNQDQELAECLEHVNVIKVDGIGRDGRGQFFPNSPDNFLFPIQTDGDYDKWQWHKLKQGAEHCCSNRLIAIQNVGEFSFYYFEYFIYKAYVFGQQQRTRDFLPPKLMLEDFVENIF